MKTIDAHNWEEPQIDEFFPGFIGNYSEGKTTPWLKASTRFRLSVPSELTIFNVLNSSLSIEESLFVLSPTILSLLYSKTSA